MTCQLKTIKYGFHETTYSLDKRKVNVKFMKPFV